MPNASVSSQIQPETPASAMKSNVSTLELPSTNDVSSKSVAEKIRSFSFLSTDTDEKKDDKALDIAPKTTSTNAMIQLSANDSNEPMADDFMFEALFGDNNETNGQIPVFNFNVNDEFFSHIFSQLAADREKQVVRSRPNFFDADGIQYFADFIANGANFEIVQVNASIAGIIKHKSKQIVVWKTTKEPTYHLIIEGQQNEPQSRNR